MTSFVVIRLKQVLILVAAVLLAVGMVLLGRWQLDVYHDQGARASARRVAAPALPLGTVAPPGVAVTDGFGRSVAFDGRYEESLQLLVPLADEPGHYRVLTALRQGDGTLVPVVRGVVDNATAPAPPVEPVHQVGVLLPSEDTPDAPSTPLAPGQIGSVRVPALAQQWSGPLIDGYVTLTASDARAQGITPAPLDLPSAPGRFRNAAYAVQWWLFAAFVLVMSVRMARDVGRSPLESAVPEITAGSSPDST